LRVVFAEESDVALGDVAVVAEAVGFKRKFQGEIVVLDDAEARIWLKEAGWSAGA
jgi:hypothetical protein